MGRDRGLAARRAGGGPVPVQAAGARLRRERRVPGPRGGVDAGRRDHRHAASRAAARRPRWSLYTRDEPARRSRTSSGSPPTRWRSATRGDPDIVRVITPVQLACGELPPITPPQSSTIKATSEDQTTQLDHGLDAATTRPRPSSRDVAAMRAIVPDPDATGLRAYVTGEAGFAADQSAALEGIDETLLAVTLALVIVLLLADLPLADRRARARVRRRDRLHRRRGARLRGREGRPLPGHRPGDGDPDRADVRRGHRLLPAAARPLPRGVRQDRTRWRSRCRRTAPAIVSAGGIVVVGDARAERRRLQRDALDGPGARDRHGGDRARRASRCCPRSSPRSAAARSRSARKTSTLWPRIGALVQRQAASRSPPRSLAILVAGALGNLSDRGTLDFSEQFRNPPESVAGPAHACRRSSRPARPARSTSLVDAQDGRRGAARARRGRRPTPPTSSAFSRDDRLALVRVTLNQDPFTEPATEAIPEIRAIARAATTRARWSAARRPRCWTHETRLARRREADRPARARAACS